jgi:F-type H+-transporting ATPase subunit delta
MPPCERANTDERRRSVQVNLPAETGDMGVLAGHVPSIEQLKPGLVEIIEEQGGSKQFFLSGGFATVQPGSVLSINAVEGYALEDFSAEVGQLLHQTRAQG